MSRRSSGAGFLLSAIAASAVIIGTSSPAAAADHDALWKIVNGACVTDQLQHGSSKPCESVKLTGGPDKGWAVLKDIVGVAQFLLIPTRKITGIEDPFILRPDAPNYWQAAWDARYDVIKRALGKLTENEIGLAINSTQARSQNQLHIHIDCVRPDVLEAVQAAGKLPAGSWTDIELAGRHYQATSISDNDLNKTNIFALVSGRLMSSETMATQSIALIPSHLSNDRGGFDVLDEKSGGYFSPAHAEDLLDHSCSVAQSRLDPTAQLHRID